MRREGGASFALVDERPREPELAALFDDIRRKRGRLLNIHRAYGHAPELLAGIVEFTSALRRISIEPALKELAILYVAGLRGSEYEISVHADIALEHGAGNEKIAALMSWRESALFDQRERCVLAYAEAVAGFTVGDEQLNGLRKFFSEKQIVELTALCSHYLGNAHFTKALGLPPEGNSPERSTDAHAG